MFDKKEMKLVSFQKAKKLMLEGEAVYLVHMDGKLEELTEATDWQFVFIHNLKGGSYAVYRKKHMGIKDFHKEFHVGKRTVAVTHAKKGDDESWLFASYRDNQ